MNWDYFWTHTYPLSAAVCVLGALWLWNWNADEAWPEMLVGLIPFVGTILAIFYFVVWLLSEPYRNSNDISW